MIHFADATPNLRNFAAPCGRRPGRFPHYPAAPSPAAKFVRGVALSLFIAFVPAGCGYTTDRNAQFKTVNANKDPIRTVCLDIMGSREFRRDLELQLTEALAKRIEAESPFKLAKKQFADTILTGEVKEVRQGTLGRDFREVRPRETAATLIVSFQWKDLRTGEVLVDHPRFVQTVDYIRPVGEDFYHAMQRACDRMAERIVEELESDNW